MKRMKGLFTFEIVRKLKEREKEMAAGKAVEIRDASKLREELARLRLEKLAEGHVRRGDREDAA